MTLLSPSASPRQIEYPENDGNPLSDHTLQFDWITLVKCNLDVLFASDSDVFVAGDLLWYPIEGDNRTRIAPDVLVAFGRPKGPRGSYREWDEGGIAPQVVVEILSPGNRFGEMLNKFLFYQRSRVEEYYLYDPFKFEFDAWIRDDSVGTLELQDSTSGFISPRLGVRFVPHSEAQLEMFLPDGRPFATFSELDQQLKAAEARADEAQRRSASLVKRLQELGVDPETI